MIAMIVSILLSLNLIATSAEYDQMTADEKEHISIVVEDFMLWA